MFQEFKILLGLSNKRAFRANQEKVNDLVPTNNCQIGAENFNLKLRSYLDNKICLISLM